MAGNYDNTNSGVLFKVKDRKSDKHPEYSGSLNINGVDYWLSAYINEKNDGEKYFKIYPKPKDEQPAAESPRSSGNRTQDDDIPF